MEIFNPKYLSLPQQVEKNKDDIEALKTKTSIHAYLIQSNYDPKVTVYQKGLVVIESGELEVGDLIFFTNSYYGLVESIGLTTFTVLSAISFRGEKGDPGDADFIKLAALNLNQSEIQLVYDSTSGATISCQGQVTYDNGTINNINIQYRIPIAAAGAGINVDAAEDNKSIVVSLECDSEPTAASLNPITSGAVYSQLQVINAELAKCGIDYAYIPDFSNLLLGYIQYSNGLQIIYGNEGGYKEGLAVGTVTNTTITFPVNFASKPLFAIAQSSGSLSTYNVQAVISNVTTTSAILQRKNISGSYITTCYVLFIGKWK